jgi:hypothetical protein
MASRNSRTANRTADIIKNELSAKNKTSNGVLPLEAAKACARIG